VGADDEHLDFIRMSIVCHYFQIFVHSSAAQWKITHRHCQTASFSLLHAVHLLCWNLTETK